MLFPRKLLSYAIIQLACFVVLLSLTNAATFEVTNTADDGEGSLRGVITQANNADASAEIRFNLSPETAQFDPQNETYTIYVTSPLPDLMANHTIELMGDEKIILDGSRSKSRFPGITVTSSGHKISGLTIQNFGGGGILVHGSDGQNISNVEIAQNRILDNGIFDENGNYGDGVRLAVNVKDVLIYDNLIARNRGNGIHFQSLTSAVWQNRAFGNFITSNKKNGIRIEGSRNIIGIDPNNTPNPNIIVQNHLHGILINGSFGHGNHLAYNYIGLGPDKNKMGNQLDGIHLKAGAKNNRIGPGLKVYYNGSGIVIKGDLTRGTEIFDNEIFGNSNEGLYLEDIPDDPPTKIQNNIIQQNLLDGIHLSGASPKIWSNHISENQRYGIQMHPYDHDNPNIFEQTDLTYAIPDINENVIERNLSGGLYALDTIMEDWERLEEKNQFRKNFDYDALVEWYNIFGFDPSSNEFGAMKVEVSACTPDKHSCFGNEIREADQGFFVGPDSLFNPRERNTFFKVTHFIIKDGLREEYSPHKITITGDQEKEFYLSDRERARKLLDPNTPLRAQSFEDNDITGPVQLTDFGNFGAVTESLKWVWAVVMGIVLFFLYHFWLAGHKIQTRENLFNASILEEVPKAKKKNTSPKKKTTTTKKLPKTKKSPKSKAKAPKKVVPKKQKL
ncbi:MAG TPA: right-handed parallel beta-helix repeat-containing protein [Candidatus Gracilibacteria bacterium]